MDPNAMPQPAIPQDTPIDPLQVHGRRCASPEPRAKKRSFRHVAIQDMRRFPGNTTARGGARGSHGQVPYASLSDGRNSPIATVNEPCDVEPVVPLTDRFIGMPHVPGVLPLPPYEVRFPRSIKRPQIPPFPPWGGNVDELDLANYRP